MDNMNNASYGGVSDYQNPYIEIPVLLLIIVVGVIGNTFVIGAVLVERTLRNMGVAFIINLAVVDLVVTAWLIPVILANVLAGYKNALAHALWFCNITGFTVSWCCQVSMMTLMFIAFGRFMRLKYHEAYQKWFTKKWTLLMIAFIWIESFFVELPLIVGWEGSGSLLGFDVDMVSCMWLDDIAHEFNVFLVVVAIFLPLVATMYFYIQIYRHVQKTRLPRKKEVSPKSLRKSNETTNEKIQVRNLGDSEVSSTAGDTTGAVRTHHARQNSLRSHKVARNRRAEERERHLMLTLLVVMVFFLLFWTPYAIVVLLHNRELPTVLRRAFGWLAISNSAVNSIIYGVLNRHFRRGYVTLFKQVWFRFSSLICCGRTLSSSLGCSSKLVHRNGSMSRNASEYKQHSVTFT